MAVGQKVSGRRSLLLDFAHLAAFAKEQAGQVFFAALCLGHEGCILLGSCGLLGCSCLGLLGCGSLLLSDRTLGDLAQHVAEQSAAAATTAAEQTTQTAARVATAAAKEAA